jgi:hypothetical protein
VLTHGVFERGKGGARGVALALFDRGLDRRPQQVAGPMVGGEKRAGARFGVHGGGHRLRLLLASLKVQMLIER